MNVLFGLTPLFLLLTQATALIEPESRVRLGDYGPCGPVALYLAARLRGVTTPWEEVQQLVGPPGDDGTHSFADLARAAAKMGMHPVGVQASTETLTQISLPAILQVRDPTQPELSAHFVVLLRADAGGVWVLDAPFPPFFIPERAFKKAWSGSALTPDADEKQAEYVTDLALASGWRQVETFAWSALGVLCLVWLLAWGRRWVRRCWLGASWACGKLPLHWIPQRPANRWIGGAALGCALLSLPFLVLLALGPFRERPRCVFSAPQIDLGELRIGMFKTSIDVHNPGDLALRIRDVSSSCVCAVVNAPKVVGPKQTAHIGLELKVTPGGRSVAVTVQSDEPEGESTVLLHWRGPASARFYPPRIIATSVPADRPYVRTVHVFYPGGTVIPEIGVCRCSPRGVTVSPGNRNGRSIQVGEVGPTNQMVGEAEVKVVVQPPRSAGRVVTNCDVPVKYGGASSTLSLFIMVDFVGGLFLPDLHNVVFSGGQQHSLLDQERQVHLSGYRSCQDVRVSNAPPWLQCRIEPGEKQGVVLRLRVIRKPPSPFMRQTIELTPTGNVGARATLFVSAVSPGPTGSTR